MAKMTAEDLKDIHNGWQFVGICAMVVALIFIGANVFKQFRELSKQSSLHEDSIARCEEDCKDDGGIKNVMYGVNGYSCECKLDKLREDGGKYF